jgi:hypothetical protein
MLPIKSSPSEFHHNCDEWGKPAMNTAQFVALKSVKKTVSHFETFAQANVYVRKGMGSGFTLERTANIFVVRRYGLKIGVGLDVNTAIADAESNLAMEKF